MTTRRIPKAVAIVFGIACAAALLAACQQPGSVLKGRITSVRGAGVEGVGVQVYSNTTEELLAQTTTDADGDFSFIPTQLAPGTWRVRYGNFDWWQDAPTWATATPVTGSVDDPAVVNIRTGLINGSASGTVTGPDGPLAGVTVRAIRVTTGEVEATATSRSDGWFGFTLAGGSFVLSFEKDGFTTRYNGSALTAETATPISVVVGRGTTGIAAELVPASTITGKVSDGESALAGITVVAVDPATKQIRGTTATAADGTFTLQPLEAVPAIVGFGDPAGVLRPKIYGSASTDPATGTPVTPVDGTVDLGTVVMGVPSAFCATSRTGADFAGADLAGADLSGCDLTYADLEGTNLSGADLSDADLTGATVKGATFAGATLSGTRAIDVIGPPAALPDAWRYVELSFVRGVSSGHLLGPGVDLSGILLRAVTLPDLDLHGADLTGTTLAQANLSGIDLSNANLTGARLGPYLTVPGADFTGADLEDAALVGDDFSNATFTGANMDGTSVSAGLTLTGVRSGGITGTPDLSTRWMLVKGYLIGDGADLRGADLSGADLTGAFITNADLSTADLTGVRSADIRALDLKLPPGWFLFSRRLFGPGADHSGVDFSGVDYSDLPLAGIDFAGATFDGASLDRADLTGTDLTGASFGGTSLVGADLGGADLTDAGFTGASDLSGADLTGADLEGTSIGDDTALAGIISSGITGTPAHLPPGWSLVAGQLVFA